MSSIDYHHLLIQDLPLWSGSIDIRQLTGGITNSNYVVFNRGRRYVVRILQDQPFLGIDRRNEVLCMEAGHQCGVSPDVVYSESGIMVTIFIEGKVLEPGDVRGGQYIDHIAAVLKAVHASGPRLTGEMVYFSPFQVVRTYAQRAKDLGARMPHGIEDAMEDVKRLERQMGPFVPTLCHNDVLAANWIFDGSRMWLVDWEYSGIGNPMFDLGNLSHNSRFPHSMDQALLKSYFGRVTRRKMGELKTMKAVSSLRECLWSLIQTVISDLDFDYHEYAADNLEAYHAFLKEVE